MQYLTNLVASALLIFLCLFSVANANLQENTFSQWKQVFRQQALAAGISPTIFDKAFLTLTLDPEVIALDSSQPEFTRNIWDYLKNAISQKRINKGRAQLRKHRALLTKIESHFGVNAEIIVAIWAMESDFGRNYGNKNIIQSLATLAFSGKSQKRVAFAQKELLRSLELLQTEKIPPQQLVGSWAGAMGQPQFIPSSFIKYAVDFDKDGKKDLWKSLPDIFASIANFLASSGWHKNTVWGEEVRLPASFNWLYNRAGLVLSNEQWQGVGITKINGQPLGNPQVQSFLFVPAGQFGPVFLMSKNFSVIKEYNQSNSYALAVAQLSTRFVFGDKIKATWPIADRALRSEEVKEIQYLLNRKGHKAGATDGKIGSNTREAIRTWQVENGLVGDGYANVVLLKRLRRD